MAVMIFLIAVSLLMALSFLAAFLWSVHKGQYHDTYTPSIRILLDEDSQINSQKENNINKNTNEHL